MSIDTVFDKNKKGWSPRWILGAILLVGLIIGGVVTACTPKEKTTTTTTTTAPAKPSSAPASQILPPPSASAPAGGMKEEKEAVVTTRPSQPAGDACITQSQLEQTVGKLCEGKTAKPIIRYRDRPTVAKVPEQKAPASQPKGRQLSAQPSPLPSPGKFWGWVHPEATATNKLPCFADRKIVGMPAQCSFVDVFPRQGNETEVEWNSRVATKNGIYVGAKTDKGTITGATFGRVEVK